MKLNLDKNIIDFVIMKDETEVGVKPSEGTAVGAVIIADDKLNLRGKEKSLVGPRDKTTFATRKVYADTDGGKYIMRDNNKRKLTLEEIMRLEKAVQKHRQRVYGWWLARKQRGEMYKG